MKNEEKEGKVEVEEEGKDEEEGKEGGIEEECKVKEDG